MTTLLNVGTLRTAFEGLPDDTPVLMQKANAEVCYGIEAEVSQHKHESDNADEQPHILIIEHPLV